MTSRPLTRYPARCAANAFLKHDLQHATPVSLNAWVDSAFGLSDGQFATWIRELSDMGLFYDADIQHYLVDYSLSGKHQPFAACCNRLVAIARGSLTGLPETRPIDDLSFYANDKCVHTSGERDGLDVGRAPHVVGLRSAAAKRLQSGTLEWTNILFTVTLNHSMPLLRLLRIEEQQRQNNENPEV